MSAVQTARPRRRYSFAKAPKRIYWELTRSCPLQCKMCTIHSGPQRHPRELTTEEALRVLSEIASFDSPPPEVVFTGGDPLCRADLPQLIRHATALDIETTLWIAPTPRVTKQTLQNLHDAGLKAVSLSVNGATAAAHQRLHCEQSFERTMHLLPDIRAAGMAMHVNTLVTDQTLVEIPAIYNLAADLDCDRWNVFFLVRTDATKELASINPAQAEVLLNWVYDISREARCVIDVLDAPHYRRIVFERLRESGVPLSGIKNAPQTDQFGLRCGNGLMHVSHVGDVSPSLFFPLAAGNVRGRSLVSIYRRSELFRDLRDPAQLRGGCSRCPYRRICGGSRARAYAETQSWNAADPLCAYQPIGLHPAY